MCEREGFSYSERISTPSYMHVGLPTHRPTRVGQRVAHKLGRKEKPSTVPVIGKVCPRVGGWERGKAETAGAEPLSEIKGGKSALPPSTSFCLLCAQVPDAARASWKVGALIDKQEGT